MLFPPAMAFVIKLMSCWGWLTEPLTSTDRQRRLRLLYATLPLPFLWFLWGYIVYFSIVLLSLMAIPLVAAYSHLRGGIPPRQQEELCVKLAGLLLFALIVLLYGRIQAVALKRFTGQWHRSLFLRLSFTLGMLLIAFWLLAVQMQSSDHFEAPWALGAGWALSIILLRQAGAVYGLWITRAQYKGE